MKIFTVLVISISFSCNNSSHKKQVPFLKASDWEISDSTVQNHIYRSDGLLSETQETHFHFFKGMLVVAMRETIKKSYDERNNLIREQTFSAADNSLSGEMIAKYDKNNNLISKIEKSSEGIYYSEENIYNDKNQLTKKIEINRTFDELKNWTLDSVTAYNNTEKKKPTPVYDTFILNFSYDKNGNLKRQKIKEIKKTEDDYHEDSVQSGDTLIKFSKYGSNFDTAWNLNHLEVKRISYNQDRHQSELTTSKYNPKGDIVEEVSYKKKKQF